MLLPKPRLPQPRHPRSPLLVVAAVLSASLAAASGCDRQAPAAAEKPIPKVSVTPVESRETVDADEYTGRTEASESVEIRARVFGYLKTIDFKDGDFVDEGKTLFTIEPDEYEAIHQQSLSRITLNDAKLGLAKAKLARDELLVKKQAVSQEEYEESVAAVNEAAATIKAAQADANKTAVDLKHTVVKAPISGRMDRALVARGSLLTGGMASGTLLTTIVKEKPMHAYFDVDERSLLRYMRQRGEKRAAAPGSLREQGMTCYLQLADEKDFKRDGTLDFVSNKVNSGTGTARVRGEFKNLDGALAGGMFVRIRIPFGAPYQALQIPEQALVTDQSIRYVYVVDNDGTAVRRNVELGEQRGQLRIVKSGLTAGEKVIVKGQQRVKPGQKVEIDKTIPMPAAEPAPTVPAPTAPAATGPAGLGPASPATGPIPGVERPSSDVRSPETTPAGTPTPRTP